MQSYKLAPFLWKELENQVMLSNDAGRFFFVSQNEYQNFIKRNLPSDSHLLNSLISEGFAFTSSEHTYLDKWSKEVRRNKACHFYATQLFIIVLTTACNQKCIYCQASAGNEPNFMKIDTALKSVELAFSSPANNITIEFQGGEPTLNALVLKESILYAEVLKNRTGKGLSLSIVTNLTVFDDDLIDWLVEHNVGICTSLDGPEYVHNHNRPMNNQMNSYDTFQKNAKKLKSIYEKYNRDSTVQAIQTTTRHSLEYGKQIVDEYRMLGCDGIYLRPLTPLGYAAQNWEEIGYSADEYLDYYCNVLDYILSLEKNGIRFREITASTLLRRILLHEAVFHTEHRSPCGGGVGQMAIHYDGDVYTCDEARMLSSSGDNMFKIGSIDDSYSKLISSPVVHAVCTASCVEGLPECCDCVYQPFCATCPVVTYGLENDIFSQQQESYHCKISKGIFAYLFDKIRHSDDNELDILTRWAEQ